MGELNPYVYVDGSCVGTAPLSVQVTAGYHTIAFDDSTYDFWYGYDVSFAYMSDSYNVWYNNPQSILFTCNDEITAWYC